MKARHLAAISDFTTAVQHLEDKANVVPDVLFREESDSAVSTLGNDFRELVRGSAAGSGSGGS